MANEFNPDDVEVYSTACLRNMLYPRQQTKKDKLVDVIHNSTNTKDPPICYVALSDYLKLKELHDDKRDYLVP